MTIAPAHAYVVTETIDLAAARLNVGFTSLTLGNVSLTMKGSMNEQEAAGIYPLEVYQGD